VGAGIGIPSGLRRLAAESSAAPRIELVARLNAWLERAYERLGPRYLYAYRACFLCAAGVLVFLAAVVFAF
jgi:hypothetical protein